MEENPLESLFWEPLRLIEDIKFAGAEVDSYQQECRELCGHVDSLASRLHTVIYMVRKHNPRFCERPTRRIVEETSHTLEACCFLVRKCKKSGILRRLVTITTVTEFKKANSSVKDAIANVNWLLDCVMDEEKGSVIGLPPITIAFPNLSFVWSFLSKLQGGSQELREAAARDIAMNVAASEQYRRFIIEEGGVPLLLKVLYDGTLQGKVNAATALRYLAVNQEQVREMVQHGIFPAFLYVLEQGAMQVRLEVILALAEMVRIDPENQKELANAKVIIHLVALMLEAIDEDDRSSKGAPSQVIVNGSISSPRETTNPEGIRSSGTVSLFDSDSHSDTSETLSDASGTLKASNRAKEKSDEAKTALQIQVTRALWLLVANNVNNSRKIAETRAILGVAKLIELAHGELQKNAIMIIMELAAVAEGNEEFRKSAFRLTSPAAKAIVKQLQRVILDDSIDPDLQVCCIRAVGSLARVFSAKDTELIRALVLKLSHSHLPVVIEAITALLKFTDEKNFLHKEHCLAILKVPCLPYLVQLVANDDDRSVQFPAIRLLSQLALHVGRTEMEAFREAATLTVLKSMAFSASTVRQYVQLYSEDDIFQTIYHLEFCQAGETHGQHPSRT